MFDVVTVDMDDTLINTQIDYDNARGYLAKWVKNNFETTLSQKEIRGLQKKYSRDLVDEYGLSKERFPQACVEAVKQIGIDSEENKQKARNIGRQAIGNKYYYRRKDFMGGAKEFLEFGSNQDFEFILLTEGDFELQKEKIEGKDLKKYFDEVIITESKRNTIRTIDFDSLIHIGNSIYSDVEPLIDIEGVDVIYIPNGGWRKKDGGNGDYKYVYNSFNDFPYRDKL